jgi:endonuclease/exonuclease/phosphatase family metal-dependent hydrolase
MGELRKVNIVGVHFPPTGDKLRRAARDTQIARLLSQYTSQAKLRLNQPFTNQASKETKRVNNYVCHIVCGDFNADSHELRELGADASGWDIQLGSVRTSSGGKAYDNFLVSRDAKDHATLGSMVLDLAQYANFSRSEQGLSDHAPIVLRVTEVPRATPTPRRRRPSLTTAVADAKALPLSP